MIDPHAIRLATPSPVQPWLRLGAGVLILMASIVVPFALWGEWLDADAPAWLEHNAGPLTIAAIGVGLLIADVLLPIPSSVVGVAMCWLLGPLWGGAAMALGLALSFAFGYLLGWLLPEERLRAWVGLTVWDAVRKRAEVHAQWWIVIARPLPMLAEMTAILAGVWRIPPLVALPLAAASSIAVASLYAASVWLGLQTPGVLPATAVAMCLPSAMWIVHRWILKRMTHIVRDADEIA